MTGKRKSLSEQLGPLKGDGASSEVALLRKAYRAIRARPDRLTHGFHSYPAQMHWAMARSLVTAFAKPGDRVLDPFCGGGTVPIEAMLAGMRSIGSDLNPLALQVAKVKADTRNPASRRRFLKTVGQVAEASERRVRERVPVRAQLSPQEAAWYAPHTLKELAGLFREIQAVPLERDRLALEVLFSSMVVKFAQQRSDTSQVREEKRIRKGLPTEFFMRKGKELVRRWRDLEEEAASLLPKRENGGSPPGRAAAPRWARKDAQKLPASLGPVDLILTSPPYPGVYDYAQHHVRRMAWLGLNVSAVDRAEMGSRRRQWEADALPQWESQLTETFAAFGRVLSPDGKALVLIGDGRLGRKTVGSKSMVARLALTQGLEMTAVVTVSRRNRGGAKGRPEHLILLHRR